MLGHETEKELRQRWEVTAGPRQQKAPLAALSKILWLGRATIEIYDEPLGESETVDVMGEIRPDAITFYEMVGERFNWEITRENHKDVEAAAKKAAQDYRAQIPRVDKRPTAAEKAEREAREEADRQARAEADIAAEMMERQIMAKRPSWADALIVAELDEDQSDSMTDYWGHTTTRRVAIGWRRGKRENFQRLREAAATFEETAHLGPGCDVWRVWVDGRRLFESWPTEEEARAAGIAEGIEGSEIATESDSIEHRENYSMGAGNYLKAGHRDSSGWCVKSYPLEYGCDWAQIEDRIPEPEAVTAEAVEGAEIQKHYHDKRGEDFWLVVLGSRVDRDQFEALRTRAKNAGGWYSRKWRSTPGGFGFGTEAEAQAFAATLADDEGEPGEPAPAVDRGAQIAEKLRDAADGYQKAIDEKTRPLTQNWTPKRGREYASRCHDGENLRRAQTAFRALADAYEAGTVPRELLKLKTTKKRIEEATRTRSGSNGYYDHHDTHEPQDTSAEAQALRELVVASQSPEAQAAEQERRSKAELQRKIDDLRGSKIDGFFPTPEAVIERMVAEADIEEDHDVLEPSAGLGDIADYVKARWPDARVHCCEKFRPLAEIIEAKGHVLICHDFFESGTQDAYDRILMNPPYERGADVTHVQHAWTHLKPGGRLVALMANGAAFNNGFAGWLAERGGWSEELGAAFSGADAFHRTGVSVRLVVIDKPEEEGPRLHEPEPEEGPTEESDGHWASDPDHPVEDWKHEVADDCTREGYHDWLQRRKEETQMRLF